MKGSALFVGNTMEGGVVEACKTVLIVPCLNRVSARVCCKHAVLSATCVCTLYLSLCHERSVFALARGFYGKNPTPIGSRPSDLIGLCRHYTKPHPPNTQGKAGWTLFRAPDCSKKLKRERWVQCMNLSLCLFYFGTRNPPRISFPLLSIFLSLRGFPRCVLQRICPATHPDPR